MWDTRKVQCLSAPPRAPLPKLQSRLFLFSTSSVRFFAVEPRVPRSTSSSGRREPSRKVRLHRSTIHGYGRPWRKDEELDAVFLARILKLPVEFAPSSTSWPALERAYLSEFLEEYPQMEGGIDPSQGEVLGGELLLHPLSK